MNPDHAQPITEEQKIMIDDCLKRHHQLNEYEQGFVQNMAGLAQEEDATFSPSQTQLLDTLWEKATRNG